MVSKRKGNNEGEEESISWGQVMEEAAAVAAMGGARRARNRYVGVRQRPSGRWVAEIKDTVQKIRMWLGTYDTAEEAARAYDEAACLLRGANTRTNFWPCSQSYSTPALPPKITKILLNRLKARNRDSTSMPTTNVPVMDHETESRDNTLFDNSFFNVPDQEYSTSNENSGSVTTTVTSSATDFSDYMIDMSCCSRSICSEPAKTGQSQCFSFTAIDLFSFSDLFDTSLSNEKDNWANVVDDKNHIGEVKQEVEGEAERKDDEEEEIEMGPLDFRFVDALGAPSCCKSPFEIAEEIMKPMEKEQQQQYGDDPTMLRETIWKYERTFSASLYAFSGVSECLKLTAGLEKTKGKGKCEQLSNRDGVKEEVGTPTEMGSCCYSCSSSSKEGGGSEYLSVWSPVDDLSSFGFSIM